jgi:tetratricopeptide (TPR) repeat protein
MFWGAFLFYLVSMAPGVEWFDSPELAQAAIFFDLTHPPGQPLFVFLTKIISWIPFGSLAWRANFFSALTCAVAVALIGELLMIWSSSVKKKSLLWAMIGVVVAMHPCVALQAIRCEVYGLYFLAAMLVIVLVEKFLYVDRADSHQPNLPRGFFLPLFVLGLAVANHHFLALLLLPYVVVRIFLLPVLLPIGQGWSIRHWSWGGLFFACGISLYLFLPIRSHAPNPPLMGWGEPGTWDGFVNFFRGRDFGIYFLFPWKDSGPLLQALGGIGWPLLVAALTVGMIGVKRYWALWVAILFAMGASTVKIFYRENPDAFGYIALVPLLLWFFLLAFWLDAARTSKRSAIFADIFLWLLVVIQIFSYGRFSHPLWRAQHHLAESYVFDLEAHAPYGAIIFLNSDHAIFPAVFSQNVEQNRPDLIYISPLMAKASWYRRYLQRRYPQIAVPIRRGDAVVDLAVANPHRPMVAENFEDLVKIQHQLKLSDYKLIPWYEWFALLPNAVTSNDNDSQFDREYYLHSKRCSDKKYRMTGTQVNAFTQRRRADFYLQQNDLASAIAAMERAVEQPSVDVKFFDWSIKPLTTDFPLPKPLYPAFISNRAADLFTLGNYYLMAGLSHTSQGMEKIQQIFFEAAELKDYRGVMLLADVLLKQGNLVAAKTVLESIPTTIVERDLALRVVRMRLKEPHVFNQ